MGADRGFADGGYAGRLVRWAREKAHIVIEIIKRDPATTGFEVLRRRWVVERTFAWIVKNRRFTRDYERLTTVAETLIPIAATATLMALAMIQSPLLKHALSEAGKGPPRCEIGKPNVKLRRRLGGRGPIVSVGDGSCSGRSRYSVARS